MNRSEILAALTAIFQDVFDTPDLVVTDDTTADDIEEWDSMNHITLIVAAERKFGVKFKTAEIEELKNVGEFVDLIAAKLGG